MVVYAVIDTLEKEVLVITNTYEVAKKWVKDHRINGLNGLDYGEIDIQERRVIEE